MARFNMDIPELELKDLRRISQESGTSVTAVIRAYCKLGVILTKRQEQGSKIIIRNPDGTEVEFLFI